MDDKVAEPSRPLTRRRMGLLGASQRTTVVEMLPESPHPPALGGSLLDRILHRCDLVEKLGVVTQPAAVQLGFEGGLSRSKVTAAMRTSP